MGIRYRTGNTFIGYNDLNNIIQDVRESGRSINDEEYGTVNIVMSERLYIKLLALLEESQGRLFPE